jgi:hypothetical protein
MNLNHHINHIIVQKIRLELVKHFQSDELDELKEQFKKEFIKINNILINEKDLKILEKYKCFEYLETLKISKYNIYINYFSGIYDFDKIHFDPKIKIIKSDQIRKQLLTNPEIKKLANEIYLVACNIQSDIEKLVKEYYLRIESCKTVEQLLEKFPDMKEFNLLKEIKEEYEKFYDKKEKIKTIEDNKKIINKFYTTYFKEGEKDERRNSSNKK